MSKHEINLDLTAVSKKAKKAQEKYDGVCAEVEEIRREIDATERRIREVQAKRRDMPRSNRTDEYMKQVEVAKLQSEEADLREALQMLRRQLGEVAREKEQVKEEDLRPALAEAAKKLQKEIDPVVHELQQEVISKAIELRQLERKLQEVHGRIRKHNDDVRRRDLNEAGIADPTFSRGPIVYKTFCHENPSRWPVRPEEMEKEGYSVPEAA